MRDLKTLKPLKERKKIVSLSNPLRSQFNLSLTLMPLQCPRLAIKQLL
jgi:hypothetical protein